MKQPADSITHPKPTELRSSSRNFETASRFYAPSREAYIGMAVLYSQDAAMKEFHNAYHPGMVELLGLAMRAFADRRLCSG